MVNQTAELGNNAGYILRVLKAYAMILSSSLQLNYLSIFAQIRKVVLTADPFIYPNLSPSVHLNYGFCASLLGRGFLLEWFVNTLRPRQNGRHFPDNIFKFIFLNESIWISIEISLKCVPKGPVNNIPSLVQIMAWRRPGDKPLSEPMMVCLLSHICVTRPQWVNLPSPIRKLSHSNSDPTCNHIWNILIIKFIQIKYYTQTGIIVSTNNLLPCIIPKPVMKLRVSRISNMENI